MLTSSGTTCTSFEAVTLRDTITSSPVHCLSNMPKGTNLSGEEAFVADEELMRRDVRNIHPSLLISVGLFWVPGNKFVNWYTGESITAKEASSLNSIVLYVLKSDLLIQIFGQNENTH